MASFGLLTDTELRLVDVLLKSGALADTPASIHRDFSDDDARDGSQSDARRYRHLRERVAMIEAIAQQVGQFVQHGSISELLRIRAQPSTIGARGARARR